MTDKTQKNNNLINANEVDEDLDINLLMNVLDAIADSPEARPIIKQKILFSQSSKLLSLVSKLINSTYWANASHDITNRPKICVSCYSTCCKHVKQPSNKLNIDVIVEKANESCEHQLEEDWLLENTCIQCLLDSCKNINLEEENPVVLLWDTVDTGNYAKWLLDSNFEFVLEN